MDSILRLIAATPDTRELLVSALDDHGVPHHDQGRIVIVEGDCAPPRPGGNDEPEQGVARVVEMLRESLAAPAREAVSVVEELDFPHEFPVTTRLDAWWSVFETSWFEKAVASAAFSIWFQPVVNTLARRAVGHECLVRLNSNRRRTGAQIMAAAAAHNALKSFDAHTRQLAIRAVAAHGNKTGSGGDSLSFLNFIPSAIDRPESCLRGMIEALRETGQSPRNFVLEAVDSGRNPDIGHLRRIGNYLREREIGFALDDVEANAEGLRLVSQLRPDYIKLDRKLMNKLANPQHAAALKRLVEISQRLGVQVVAKGVERVSVMEQLCEAGVYCMQGYLFGSPAPDMAALSMDLASLGQPIQPGWQQALCGTGW